jgi:hypothetical protein
MVSWRGVAIRAVAGRTKRLILLLLDSGIVQGASPDSLPVQEITELNERRNRGPRSAERHPAAGTRIQHPRRYRDDLAGKNFHMNDIATSAALPVLTTEAPPIECRAAIRMRASRQSG